ncbi:mediator of RNA polymerase II transcription subunit 15a [Lolium perenne]|uniref:mediator of RNA polymerase II transcription subunit 15a n=1 Tax=Lolium perenne TaxID=4522 RepID=UPI0021F69CC7|nr:mediator of RNA polymerase II transcription subunit 15a isoform X1 [Lolium perenne]
MDANANWRPTQGSDPAAAAAAAAGVDPNAPAGGDWRTQLQPEARSRIVNKIMETLKKHLPVSVPEGLNELQKIAVRFEEKIYTAATNQSDYLRKISLKMLSMETKTQQGPGNAQVIPNQNNPGQAPGLPQGSNQTQTSAIPLMSQQQGRQPNTSSSVQASSLTSIGQNMPGVNQTSTMQNVSVMPQNTMNNGLMQGSSQDIYAAQRQMAGRQQQQSQQLMYQQQQQMLMKQKLQQNSLMQPHIQQQQSLLQPTQQSSQQPIMQMPSGLHQSTVPQTQPMAMQSATQSGIQQNQLNSVQSVQSLLQQPQQSVGRQQQQGQPSMHQQSSIQSQQPNIPLQQQQQQLIGQQSNLQQNQLIGQQNAAVEMQQQQQQQRLPVQSNNLLNVQQTQQMLNQQSMPLHQPQQLGSQTNMSSLQQQQQNQQQQLLGTVNNVSNMQRMHMLQTKAQQPQQQQHAQQPSMGLMQPQSQHNQLQQSQQHLMAQFQSQPNQLPQQLGISMQQRLQTSGGMLLQQNNMDQPKQFIQAQRGLQEVSSSTSADSTAQTGHAGAGDWQEETYQMIKNLKDKYAAELSELFNKISQKLQQVDNTIPPLKPSEQYDRMKSFKVMLERILQVLNVSKNGVQPGLSDKVPQYEKQIINILNSQRRKPLQPQVQQQFQSPAGQAPNSNISQQQQPSQSLQQHDSHTNPQASLSSMSTGLQSSSAAGIQHVPAPPATNFSVPTQQNGANVQQQQQLAGSNLEAAQGSNFSSLQHGSMSGTLQQGSTGQMQGTMNTQLQTSSMLSHNSMSTMQPNANSMQANASSLQQMKQQQQDHQMMQNQQMKRQMFQQYHQKQMLQQQLPVQQQLQKQHPVQMQIPQLHAGNDVNELKVRQGTAMKPGMYQQHLGQRSNYYHQQLKQGAFPISSPQSLQASSPQISHHSPQVDHHNSLQSQVKTGTPLHSANSPFVPSPSPSVAPSPIPVDSDKPLSGISSLTNIGQAGHQQTSLAPHTQTIAVNTPGISASPLLAEFTSADGSLANMPTQAPIKSSAAERPLDRLLKALRTTQRPSLNAAVSDIRSVVSMIDRIAGSAPGNGSRAAVGEDLVAMTKCRLQARNFITNDGSGASKKMKRDTSAMPLNVSSAGSVNDSFKQIFGVDTPDLQSTATSRVKWQKIEVNYALMEEIQEINQQLIDTELRVCEDDADSSAATSEWAEGTVIKCTYTAVAVSPSLKSMFASAQMSPIMPLRLLVPAGYPKCSPVLLDKFPDEQRNSDDLSSKAKSKFGTLLRGLAEPMSLQEIARTWDACARKVIEEYAQKTGGGSFSSSYGCWESCVGA